MDLEFARTVLEPALAGKYEFCDLIGTGGMGVVYRAIQVSLRRPVAIKCLAHHFFEPSYMVRFRSEAALAGRTFHSNLVAVIEAGQVRGQPYIVFELVEGRTLRELLNETPVLAASEALFLARQAASGLDCAHRAGVVHRDVKPENLLLRPDGLLKIADFGLAKQLEPVNPRTTRTGVVLGTPYYMAPEQIQGEVLTGAADIYALGAVLYEALVGFPPFTGKLFDILQGHMQGIPAALPESFPVKVRAMVSRCLEKRPSDRFASMGEFVSELDSAVHELTQQSRILAGHPTIPMAPVLHRQAPDVTVTLRMVSPRIPLHVRLRVLCCVGVAALVCWILTGSPASILARQRIPSGWTAPPRLPSTAPGAGTAESIQHDHFGESWIAKRLRSRPAQEVMDWYLSLPAVERHCAPQIAAWRALERNDPSGAIEPLGDWFEEVPPACKSEYIDDMRAANGLISEVLLLQLLRDRGGPKSELRYVPVSVRPLLCASIEMKAHRPGAALQFLESFCSNAKVRAVLPQDGGAIGVIATVLKFNTLETAWRDRSPVSADVWARRRQLQRYVEEFPASHLAGTAKLLDRLCGSAARSPRALQGRRTSGHNTALLHAELPPLLVEFIEGAMAKLVAVAATAARDEDLAF